MRVISRQPFLGYQNPEKIRLKNAEHQLTRLRQELRLYHSVAILGWFFFLCIVVLNVINNK